MIRSMKRDEVADCVKVIKDSFQTVADEFGFTTENAPGFTAFATNEDKLLWLLNEQKRLMYVYCKDDKIVGYYSLTMQENNECEINNLAVLPMHRHEGIGHAMLEHCFDTAKEQGCHAVNIGIVEENQKLRRWYESIGFKHVGTQKYDCFPFTCGYMKKEF